MVRLVARDRSKVRLLWGSGTISTSQLAEILAGAVFSSGEIAGNDSKYTSRFISIDFSRIR